MPSYLDYKRVTQPPSEATNTEKPLTQNRNVGIKLTKDFADNYKFSNGSKLLTGKNDDYRKHARIKTEAHEETISDKISQIYSKLSNLAVNK